MKSLNLVKRFLTGFIILISFNACNEDSEALYRDNSNQAKSEYTHWEQIDFSNFVYEQLKYNAAYFKTETLLPQSIHDEYMNMFNALQLEVNNMDFQDAILHLQKKGAFSRNLAKAFIDSQRLFDTYYYDSSIPKLSLVRIQINKRIEFLKKSTLLTIEEKKTAVAHLSVIKGILQYFEELFTVNQSITNYEGVNLRGCSVWDRLRCIIVSAGLGIAGGITIGAIIGGDIGSASEIPGGAEVGSFLGGIIGGTIGGIIGGIVGIFINTCCTPDFECFAVVGISLKFFNCSSEAEYTTWGFGRDDVTLIWENEGGIPATATTPVIDLRSAKLIISQELPNTPVRTTITSVCSNQQTNAPVGPFVRDLHTLAKSVQGVELAGEDQVAPGFTYSYFGFGLSNNPNYTTQWFVNEGTILSSSNEAVTIQWNSELTNAWVQMRVTNNCPGGQTSIFTLNMTGDGSIP